MTTKQDFECRDEECVDPKCPFYHPAALPESKPTYELAHKYIPHGTGSVQIEQLMPLLVEHLELRQVVKQYREGSFAHPSCSFEYQEPCETCIKADLLLAPKPADPKETK